MLLLKNAFNIYSLDNVKIMIFLMHLKPLGVVVVVQIFHGFKTYQNISNCSHKNNKLFLCLMLKKHCHGTQKCSTFTENGKARVASRFHRKHPTEPNRAEVMRDVSLSTQNHHFQTRSGTFPFITQLDINPEAARTHTS